MRQLLVVFGIHTLVQHLADTYICIIRSLPATIQSSKTSIKMVNVHHARTRFWLPKSGCGVFYPHQSLRRVSYCYGYDIFDSYSVSHVASLLHIGSDEVKVNTYTSHKSL